MPAAAQKNQVAGFQNFFSDKLTIRWIKINLDTALTNYKYLLRVQHLTGNQIMDMRCDMLSLRMSNESQLLWKIGRCKKMDSGLIVFRMKNQRNRFKSVNNCFDKRCIHMKLLSSDVRFQFSFIRWLACRIKIKNISKITYSNWLRIANLLSAKHRFNFVNGRTHLSHIIRWVQFSGAFISIFS